MNDETSMNIKRITDNIETKLEEAAIQGIASGFRSCLEMVKNKAHEVNSLEDFVKWIDWQYEINHKYKETQNQSETADKSV